MFATITNNISIVNDEGDSLMIPQVTIQSIIINYIPSLPFNITKTDTTILVTQKNIPPIIITKLD